MVNYGADGGDAKKTLDGSGPGVYNTISRSTGISP